MSQTALATVQQSGNPCRVHPHVCGERQPKRLDGRERYLPLLRETIETPFEIWANFAQNELGRIGLRRYDVKRVEVIEDGKAVALTLIAEVLSGGRWGSIDFFRGRAPQVTSRSGVLVWGRP
ncbi:MAG TPA: PBECR2 nuclease fold domain-containing protein [Aquimonas sp.]|nr:PBECR2 nuclease fold domain-containing protein [Aquimonas sp.]